MIAVSISSSDWNARGICEWDEGEDATFPGATGRCWVPAEIGAARRSIESHAPMGRPAAKTRMVRATVRKRRLAEFIRYCCGVSCESAQDRHWGAPRATREQHCDQCAFS